MAEADDGGTTAVSEPLDLVRLLLDEVVFVKLRGDRELKGRLHVSDEPSLDCALGLITSRLTTVIATLYWGRWTRRYTW